MAKQEEVKVSEAAFLKSLNKNKQAAKAASKKERPSGSVDNATIMARLGLTAEGDRVSIPGRVSKIQMGFAKKDSNRPYFRFAYVLTDNSPHSGQGKGTIVSNYHELTEATNNETGEVWRTVEEAYEKMYFEFQGIGVNTSELGDDMPKLLAIAKEHTAAKTPVQMSFSVYASEKRGLGLNISAYPVNVDNSDLKEDDTSSDESEESDVFNADDWIGGWVTWTDDEGSVEMKVTSYDEDTETFSGEDEEGSTYEGAPIAECEWMEPQPGESE